MTQSRLQQTVAQYRAQLLAREASAEQALQHAYQHTLAAIQPTLDALYQAIQQKQADGEEVPLSWLYEQRRLATLQQLVTNQINHFAALAQTTAGHMQRQGASLGNQSAQDQLEATVPPGVAWSFGVPSHAALVDLVGATQDGSPLADLFQGFGEEAAQNVGKALISGLMNGDNPRTVASQVQAALDVPRWRALTIARNEMLRAYKSAAVANYQANSDVVGQWRWQADKSARTCAACLAMDGSLHDLSETLDSHVQCFPAGTMVSGPCVVGSTKRLYTGDLVEIETSLGHFLSVTPNHPILTPNGWVKAGELVEGDYVVSRIDSKRPFRCVHPDEYQVPALIEKVVETFTSPSNMTTVSVPTTPKDFHNDGADGDICIIRAYRHLTDGGQSRIVQPLNNSFLMGGNVRLSLLPYQGTFAQFLKRTLRASHRIMSRLSAVESLLIGHATSHNTVCFACGTSLDTSDFQPFCNSTARYPVGHRKRLLRVASEVTLGDFLGRQGFHLSKPCFHATQGAAFLDVSKQSTLSQFSDQSPFSDMEETASVFGTLAGDICQDSILKIKRRSFSGHVYNLQTTLGWYVANNIITHNCRCAPVPVTKSWADILGPLGIDTSDIPDASAANSNDETGSDWFDNQDEATQRAILGNAKYEAYSNGDITLADLVGTKSDPQWGDSIYERSLADALAAAQAGGSPDRSQSPSEAAGDASGSDLTFPDGLDAQSAFLQAQQADALATLTDDERDSIKEYTYLNYRDINSSLRDPSSLDPSDQEWVSEEITKLDAALAKGAAPVDMTVYRGVDVDSGMLDYFAQNVGKVVQDNAYGSTSLNAERASVFADEGGAIISIQIPQGYPGLYISPLSLYDQNSNLTPEYEYLLPRGTKYAIVGYVPATQDAKAQFIFEVLP